MISRSPRSTGLTELSGGGVLLADDAGGFVQNLAHHVVGQALAEEFVEHDSQGVHVRALIDSLGVALGLLRAHVRHSSHQLADVGPQAHGLEVGVDQPRDPEVQDLRLAAGVHEDVGGLEVAVDHPSLVGVPDRVADPPEQRQTVPGPQLVLPRVLVQSRAVNELHGEVGLGSQRAFAGAGVEDLGDSGMLEGGPGLPARARSEATLTRRGVREGGP